VQRKKVIDDEDEGDEEDDEERRPLKKQSRTRSEMDFKKAPRGGWKTDEEGDFVGSKKKSKGRGRR